MLEVSRREIEGVTIVEVHAPELNDQRGLEQAVFAQLGDHPSAVVIDIREISCPTEVLMGALVSIAAAVERPMPLVVTDDRLKNVIRALSPRFELACRAFDDRDQAVRFARDRQQVG